MPQADTKSATAGGVTDVFFNQPLNPYRASRTRPRPAHLNALGALAVVTYVAPQSPGKSKCPLNQRCLIPVFYRFHHIGNNKMPARSVGPPRAEVPPRA